MELDAEYDLIVLGTGFVESVIAGAAARAGKKVLHLDQNDFYGGYTASFPLQSFEKIIQETPAEFPVKKVDWPSDKYNCVSISGQVGPRFSNVKVYTNPKSVTEEGTTTTTTTTTTTNDAPQAQSEGTSETTSTTTQSEVQETPSENATKSAENSKTENNNNNNTEKVQNRALPYDKLMAVARQFSIDIIPRLLFSRGDMVNLLISSAVGRYLEFKCLEKSFLYVANSIQPVPCSKGDIFKSKFISNSERLKLTRFLQLIQSDLEQEGKIDRAQFASFYDFVKGQGLSPNLEAFVLYAISMVKNEQQNAAEKVSAVQGLRDLETYISSVGKYGNTPFLISLYGISELPQAFCRLCAVYGGVYVLRRSAQCLLVDKDANEFRGLICTEGQTLNAPHFVTSGSYIPDLFGAEPKLVKTSRAVVAADAPLLQIESEYGQSSVLILPPNTPNVGNPNAIHVLQFDNSLAVAPKGHFLLHFVTETTETAERDLEKAVAFLLNIPQVSNPDPTKPYANWVGYFDLNLRAPVASSSTQPKNVHIVSEGPGDTGIDYRQQLAEAKEVFDKMFPNNEFLPRVPNPEEIIWTGEGDGEKTEIEQNPAEQETAATEETQASEKANSAGETETEESRNETNEVDTNESNNS